jgi:nitrite reductase/ring-hydroxylating ferredoxin subunit
VEESNFITTREYEAAKETPQVLQNLRDEIQISPDGRLAYSTVCPHFGGPLQIDFAAATAWCRWHDWRFSLISGRCINRNINCHLRKYSVDLGKDGAWLTDEKF